MAIKWGTWREYNGNGMRIGLNVSWSAVSHTSESAIATIEVWTENKYNHDGDSQRLTYSGSISGTKDYTNNEGTGTTTKRDTKSFTHDYTTYGSSPGSVTFAASLSLHYWDGGTNPSVSESYTIPARPALAPAAPVLTATTASSSQINLSWTAPDNNGSSITDYTLQASPTSSTSGFATIGPSGASTTRTYSYTGLTKYKQYWFRVSATNGVGTSGYSTVKTATTSATVPGAPTGLTATPGVTSVALSWTAPADTGGIGFDLVSNGDYVVKRGATTVYTGPNTTFTDTGVDPATAYTYTVEAVNSIGSSPTTSVSTTTIGGIMRVWNGSDWVTWTGLPKVWNGSAWVTGNARVYTGVGATEDDKWKYGI